MSKSSNAAESSKASKWHVVTLQMSSRRILHGYLRVYPYKIHVTHELREQDKALCGNFSGEFLDLVLKELVLNILIM
jgi:hypothetical protein